MPHHVETGIRLGDRARQAVLWNFAFNFFRDGLQFCVMLVLVRILTQEDYGKFHYTTTIVGVIGVFGFQNFLSHTLQLRRDGDVDFNIHFAVGGIIQTVLFVATNVIAFNLALFGERGEVAPLLHILSVTFLLEWPCDIRRKMLERTLNWKRLCLLNAVGLILSAAAGIGMALVGMGVYALIVPGLLVGLPFIVDLFFAASWRPSFANMQFRDYWPALKFGFARFGSAMAIRGMTFVEASLLLEHLGFAMLGIFTRATSLSRIFCYNFAFHFFHALYPALTKIDPGTPEYRRVSALVFRCVSWVVVPAGVVFSLVAVDVVSLLYGERWSDVGPLVPFAMCAGAVAALGYAAYMLLLANEAPKFCFLIDFMSFLGVVVFLNFAADQGLKIYLVFLSLLALSALMLSVMRLTSLKGLDFKGALEAILPAVVATAIAAMACQAAHAWLDDIVGLERFGPAVVIPYGIAFSLCYVFVLRIIFARLIIEMLPYLPFSNKIKAVLLFAGVP